MLLYKKSRTSLQVEESMYGSVIVITKLCENQRKTRDIVNAIMFETEATPCMDIKKVLNKQYFDKKDLLIRSEISVLSLLAFDMKKINTIDYYSLLLSICYLLKMNNKQVQLAWNILNESFLCENFDADDYPDVVASCVCLALKNTEKNRENIKENEDSQATTQEIQLSDEKMDEN